MSLKKLKQIAFKPANLCLLKGYLQQSTICALMNQMKHIAIIVMLKERFVQEEWLIYENSRSARK